MDPVALMPAGRDRVISARRPGTDWPGRSLVELIMPIKRTHEAARQLWSALFAGIMLMGRIDILQQALRREARRLVFPPA